MRGGWLDAKFQRAALECLCQSDAAGPQPAWNVILRAAMTERQRREYERFEIASHGPDLAARPAHGEEAGKSPPPWTAPRPPFCCCCRWWSMTAFSRQRRTPHHRLAGVCRLEGHDRGRRGRQDQGDRAFCHRHDAGPDQQRRHQMTGVIFAERDMLSGFAKRRACRSICDAAAFVGLLLTTGAAVSAASPEARYIATRDAAIGKFSPLYDAGALDEAATKAEAVAFADLQAQMSAILQEPARKGFGAARLCGGGWRGGWVGGRIWAGEFVEVSAWSMAQGGGGGRGGEDEVYGGG